MSSQPEDNKEASANTVRYEFIKSKDFRTIHVDGAWGGLSPATGVPYINMAIFSQRHAIPQAIENELIETPQGQLIGPELLDKRVGREAIVREVEANLTMDVPAAVSVALWLLERLMELSKRNVINPKELRDLTLRIVGEESES